MKQGFTLIELLAVIVILAIIAVIATPIVLNIINDAKESAVLRSAEFYLNGVETSVAISKLNNQTIKDGTYDILPNGNICLEEYDLNTRTCKDNDGNPNNNELIVEVKGEKPNSGKVSVNEKGKVAISAYSDRYYAKKDYDDADVEVYEIIYYSTLNGAVDDINNDDIGANANATRATAVAAVYVNKENQPTAVLLQDTTETERIKVAADMTINLGGHKLSTKDKVGIDILSGHLIIDGKFDGSGLEMESTTSNVTLIQARENTDLLINGGIYKTYSEGFKNKGFIIGGTADISNVEVNVVNEKKASNDIVSSIEVRASGEATISNVILSSKSIEGLSYGLANEGKLEISNSDIKAYSNDPYSGSVDVSFSVGIVNDGTLAISNSYVTGTHSGISNHSSLYIDGGIYEGYRYGGIYFGGTETISYVENARIRECDMPEGYTQTIESQHIGVNIGGGNEFNNIKVYMDNNDIYGSSQPIVLRGSGGEQNNTLFISNSRINLDGNIRIDNDTHKLYIGKGNNFTADNTNLPSAVVDDEGKVYTRENIEK